MSNWTLDFFDWAVENRYMDVKTFGLKWSRFTLCLVLLIGWKYCKYHLNIYPSGTVITKHEEKTLTICVLVKYDR